MTADAEMKAEAAAVPTQTAIVPENPAEEEIWKEETAEEGIRKWIAEEALMTAVRRISQGEAMTAAVPRRRGRDVIYRA